MIKARELLYHDEFDDFIELSRIMLAESEPDLAYSEVTVRANLLHCVNDIQREWVNVWIVRDGKTAIGFAVGHVSQFLMSEQRKACLLYWFVHPKYRRTRAAFELLHNFENWATLSGAVRIEVGAAKCVADDANALNRMFEKRKFKQYGALYYREPKFNVRN